MNKYSLILGVFLTVLFLSASVFAASVELPGATIMQGDSWEISLNCPNMGTPGDICLVEWIGPVDGNFIEQDSGSDPDPVNKHQTLDVAGSYTYTIRECPTGIGSCGAVNDTETVTVIPSVGEIWTTYRSRVTGPWAPSLKISGIAPAGTTKIQLYVRGENNGATVVPMTLADFNNETNYYSKNFSLKTVYETNPQILNVQAAFINEVNGTTIDSARVVVEALLLDVIQADVDQLELDVYDLNTLALDLNSRTTVLEQQVADLNSQDANFQNQLNEVNARLADHDQNIIDLQTDLFALDQRVTDLNAELTLKINDLNTELTQMINDLNAEMQAAIANLQSQIDALDVRLTALENIVSRMNHGTISIAYDRDDDKLRIKGEAPEGAATVDIQIRDVDRVVVSSYIVNVNTSDNSYELDLTGINSLSPQIYDVRAVFRDSGNGKIGQSVVTQFYALAVLEDFQGFGFIEDKTFEYFLVLPSERAMAFNFGALTEGQYDFNLIMNNGNITNEFLLSSHISKYNGQEFNTLFDVPAKGIYLSNIIAYNQTTGETITSNEFTIEIVDLFDNLKGAVAINSPINNDNIYSAQASTFYTNGNFTMVPVVNGVSLGVDCRIKLGTDILYSVALNGNNCSQQITLDDISMTDGLFELRVDNIVNNITPADFNLGIDYSKPQFPDLNSQAIIPSTGAYSGILHVDVNTWDVLSGVSTVLIDLIDKNTGLIVSSAFASYNSTTGYWDHDFNTILLGIPDGNYDIMTTVTDVAGNIDDRIVDPTIDNTRPIIVSIDVITTPILRNTTITIDANISDNLAGVKEVTAVMDNGITTKSLVLALTSGNALSGIWSVDVNVDNTWTTGTYTVTVDANDYAIPSNEAIAQTTNVKMLKNYYFNIDTSASGTASRNFTFDGNFRNDEANVPTITDGNVILITSNAVSDVNVIFDANGLYTINTNSLSAGTYVIDLNYNQTDYNYTERITLTLSNPPTVTPSPGGGGGTSGTPSGNERDTNEPVEVEVPEEPVEPTEVETPAETGGETETGTGTDETTDGNDNAVTPTGLFGLGEIESVLPGILALIAIIIVIVGIVIVKKKK